MTPECDYHCLLRFAENGRARLFRPGLTILNGLALSPLGNCLRVDPVFLAQFRDRSLRSLYCRSDGVRGRGAAMTYLSHSASFHSKEQIAPSNHGIKHLGCKLIYKRERMSERLAFLETNALGSFTYLLRHCLCIKSASAPAYDHRLLSCENRFLQSQIIALSHSRLFVAIDRYTL